jgi:general secretion pathway protein G
MTKTDRAQKGFSLMELLIALMIIGVIATLGIKGYSKYADRARYTKANNDIKLVAEGLEQHYLAVGRYPEGTSWESLVGPESPLVKKNYMPANMPVNDPWGQPYEAKVTKGTYELKCAGDPNDLEERPPIVREPGKQVGGPSAGQDTKPKGDAPAGAPAK